MITVEAKTITSSQAISSVSSEFVGMLIGTDGVNDPSITVYDNSVPGGDEIVPTNTYDASRYDLNGVVLPFKVNCSDGIYVAITCAGNVEVTVFWRIA